MIRYIKCATETWEEMTKQEQKDWAWEYLSTLTSDDALRLAINLLGDSYKSYCQILYAITGYRDFDQVFDEEI